MARRRNDQWTKSRIVKTLQAAEPATYDCINRIFPGRGNSESRAISCALAIGLKKYQIEDIFHLSHDKLQEVVRQLRQKFDEDWGKNNARATKFSK